MKALKRAVRMGWTRESMKVAPKAAQLAEVKVELKVAKWVLLMEMMMVAQKEEMKVGSMVGMSVATRVVKMVYNSVVRKAE